MEVLAELDKTHMRETQISSPAPRSPCDTKRELRSGCLHSVTDPSKHLYLRENKPAFHYDPFQNALIS